MRGNATYKNKEVWMDHSGKSKNIEILCRPILMNWLYIISLTTKKNPIRNQIFLMLIVSHFNRRCHCWQNIQLQTFVLWKPQTTEGLKRISTYPELPSWVQYMTQATYSYTMGHRHAPPPDRTLTSPPGHAPPGVPLLFAYPTPWVLSFVICNAE